MIPCNSALESFLPDLTEMIPCNSGHDLEATKKGEEILNSKRKPRHHKQTGKVVILNKKKLVLFRFKNKVYALDEKCPHMGKRRLPERGCESMTAWMR